MLSLADHRAARIAALCAPDGWLNLVARIDLSPGTHLVGAAQEVRLPSGPDLLGTLTVARGSASFARPGAAPEPFCPVPDAFPQLRVDPFLLELHTVDGTPALRVRDLSLTPKADLRYFPEAPDWTIRAAWEEIVPRAGTVDMKGGTSVAVTLTHRARFIHQGCTVTLTPTHWKGGKPMFVFRDATAGETYGAGRFLIGEAASNGEITLDFNRAFTPPCAFTAFAICPLPPPGNVLPFRIEAGELAPNAVS
ncbi:DUF1684 domain-containing protein [Rhodobacter sp. Har01]|uniref:DUF1684 domain-containing protein n=1 Tax=Rhodobacter sp. Har01 TaxID=2883999 RepID=UPI001D074EBC|nr:DUF1684 domain-containing protein [Rhodobacter sp. Har01]MCB6177311.1 DUF1684 domain-containing protein [Rhodobacter sp. Har01]